MLAFVTGNPDNPVNSVPSTARARCQIRHTVDVPRENFVPALRRHLDEYGFEAVEIGMDVGRNQFAASRTDPNHPWVQWMRRSVVETTGSEPNILPCSSGSNPSELFKAGLDVPVIWMPHSYSGCHQHGADEHGLKSLFREGLGTRGGAVLGSRGRGNARARLMRRAASGSPRPSFARAGRRPRGGM